MFTGSDNWLGIGIAVIIGSFVVGFAVCMGKLIIRLFGTGREAIEPSGRAEATIKLHETA